MYFLGITLHTDINLCDLIHMLNSVLIKFLIINQIYKGLRHSIVLIFHISHHHFRLFLGFRRDQISLIQLKR